MSKYILSTAIFIIALGFIGCIGSLIFNIGDPSAFTGYGCAAGLICAGVYYFASRNTPVG